MFLDLLICLFPLLAGWLAEGVALQMIVVVLEVEVAQVAQVGLEGVGDGVVAALVAT